MARRLQDRFESIRLDTTVRSLTAESDGVVVVLVSGEGQPEEVRYDRVLVAVGRRPNSDGMGLTEAGIEVDEAGRLVVDQTGCTTVEHILDRKSVV